MNAPRDRSMRDSLSPQQGNENVGFFDDTFDNNDSDISGVSDSSGDHSDKDSSSENLNANHSDAPSSKGVSWLEILKGITIEPMMFAHMFAVSSAVVILQTLYIERICKVSLEYSDEVCDNLSDSQNNVTSKEVARIASRFMTYRGVIEAAFPIFISLFLGPWTEIHGTKLPMILPLFGYFLTEVSYLIFSFIPSAQPELMLVSSIPISLVGGVVSIIMSAFSFMSKNTSVETRSFRVGMLEIAWVFGGPLGTLSGGFMKEYGGYTVVFATSASILLAAFIYGCIIIREKLPEIEDNRNRNWFTDIFKVQSVKEMLFTVVQKRKGPRRRWLLLLLLTISLRIFAMVGYNVTMYLYTRTKFSWDAKEYSIYSASDAFISIGGAYIMLMVCMKILKVPDAIIGIISTVGVTAAQFMFAFGVSGWMMYIGAALQMFSGVITIILRSMISKIIAKEETAKVFTVLACGEASMPLVAVPLYSYIFTHTIYTFPGAPFMLSAGVYLFILTTFIYVNLSMRNEKDNVEMKNPSP